MGSLMKLHEEELAAARMGALRGMEREAQGPSVEAQPTAVQVAVHSDLASTPTERRSRDPLPSSSSIATPSTPPLSEPPPSSDAKGPVNVPPVVPPPRTLLDAMERFRRVMTARPPTAQKPQARPEASASVSLPHPGLEAGFKRALGRGALTDSHARVWLRMMTGGYSTPPPL